MNRTFRPAVAAALAVAVVLGIVGLAYAAATTINMNPGDSARTLCPKGRLGVSKSTSHDWTTRCRSTSTATATATTSTSATATTSTSATATTSTSATATTSTSATATVTPGTWGCTVPIGGNCGPYGYDGIPMSNGYDTYVANQAVDVHGTETVNANNPGDWNVVANLSDCGGCVQTFANVTQLTNDWNGTGWGGSGSQDTPWRQLSTLSVNYNETSPASGASYEFAPDVWGPGPWDIMFWVDTQGRCNEGSFGPTLLGHLTIDGQPWTAHAYGDEIILVLDGPGGPGTCAQQSSGTINIKAGLDWLWNGGFITGTTLQQLNTGWEITQSSGATFTVHSYGITAN